MTGRAFPVNDVLGERINRVLIVDDNEDELSLLHRCIASLPETTADTATTCAEAVRLLSKNHYDVVVIDLILTGDYWTGIEMCNYAEKAGMQAILVCSEPRLGRAFGTSRPVLQKETRYTDILTVLRSVMPQAAASSSPIVQLLRGVKA